MKLRIDGIGGEVNPHDLMLIFEQHGSVSEISLHYDGKKVAYGILTMADRDALTLLDDRPTLKWNWRYLRVKKANRASGPWLSHDWQPPTRLIK